MKTCEHNDFTASVGVARLTEVEGGPATHFAAEIRIECAECGQKFEFVGLPLGSSAYKPTVSMDGEELRAPIAVKGTKPPEGLPGFSVSMSAGGPPQ